MNLQNISDSLENLEGSSRAEQEKLYELLTELQKRKQHEKLFSYYPDEGPYRRELYQKHLDFFKATKKYGQVCFLAGNRTGKTTAGCYMDAVHLTGLYPDWWEGRTFDKPVDWWVAGKTKETVRDTVQKELFGPPGRLGTGMIPKDRIVETRQRPNGGGALDFALIKHGGGGDIQAGESIVGFKGYDQGVESFFGTAKHGVHLDEECPEDIYGECLVRTMTTNGLVVLTFTPLKGLTPIVLTFLPEMNPDV